MKKNSMCIFLCLLFALGFSGCSGNNELTQSNVNQTVLKVEKALKSFDEEDLKKYVESDTLSKILSVSNGKTQFAELGRAIFENLSIEITHIDIEAKTVTVSVKNKDLSQIASDFANDLSSTYSAFQLLGKLNDDEFLDAKLGDLTKSISQAEMQNDSTRITLSIKQGNKNLVIGFDEDAENAVSGGALGAIMKTFSSSL